DQWVKTGDWELSNVPDGEYFLQAVWRQSGDKESRINVPGNLYSEPVKVSVNNNQEVTLVLSKVMPERELVTHDLVKMVDIKSDLLSDFWKKPMNLKASVLLPSGYESNPNMKYPVRFNVAGFGG